MSHSFRQRLGIAGLLALAMLATRVNHFAPIPDASWAVFFAAGFYLRGSARWAFPALMALAVAVDVAVIGFSGTSLWDHYCMSAAYWFLVPAHAAMWLGGSTLRRTYEGLEWRATAWLLVTFLVGYSACFTIANGSFFWLADGSWVKSMPGWFENFGHYYLPYLRSAAMYVAGAALLHVVVALLVREKAPARSLAG
jgi:hypothetical protein